MLSRSATVQVSLVTGHFSEEHPCRKAGEGLPATDLLEAFSLCSYQDPQGHLPLCLCTEVLHISQSIHHHTQLSLSTSHTSQSIDALAYIAAGIGHHCKLQAHAGDQGGHVHHQVQSPGNKATRAI